MFGIRLRASEILNGRKEHTTRSLLPDNVTRPALKDARDILTGQKGLYRGTFLGVPMSFAFASRCNDIMALLLLLKIPYHIIGT